MEKHISSRRLKKDIGRLLLTADSHGAFQPILEFPERVSINALLSSFFDPNELVKWRAVSAAGMVVNQLAGKNMESARVIVRRLMWMLNDESGGIGWGVPEAMGDILARNEKLALEYHRILISYVMEDRNYLEHEVLQRGVLWGLGRLSHARPELVLSAAEHFNPFMASADAIHRGLAAWAVSPLHAPVNVLSLSKLTGDSNSFPLYGNDYTIRVFPISRVAIQALSGSI
jgi:hypothetical protein